MGRPEIKSYRQINWNMQLRSGRLITTIKKGYGFDDLSSNLILSFNLTAISGHLNSTNSAELSEYNAADENSLFLISHIAFMK